MKRVIRGDAHRQFWGIRFANNNRPSIEQILDNGRMTRRSIVRHDGHSVGRRRTFIVNIHFNRDGNPL